MSLLGPEDFRERIIVRMQSMESLAHDEVKALGIEPDNPDLVRFDYPDGGSAWPTFQFSDGEISETVRRVNQSLHRTHGDAGKAGWWLSPNPIIGDVPAHAVGRISDDLIIAAVRHAVEPWGSGVSLSDPEDGGPHVTEASWRQEAPKQRLRPPDFKGAEIAVIGYPTTATSRLNQRSQQQSTGDGVAPKSPNIDRAGPER
jgi:hypothetical protein